MTPEDFNPDYLVPGTRIGGYVVRTMLGDGFRDMFDCSIADTLSAKRLEGARTLLLSTDLPVASIGYRCGYLNNASFTRAFARRFGAAPTQYRAGRLAA